MARGVSHNFTNLALKLEPSEEFVVEYDEKYRDGSVRSFALFVTQLYYTGGESIGVSGPSRNANGTRGYVSRSYSVKLASLSKALLLALEVELNAQHEQVIATYRSRSKRLNSVILEKMEDETE